MTFRCRNTRRITAGLSLGLFLAVVCLPLTAAKEKEPQPAVPNSQIRGKVLGPDGEPLSGGQVFAYLLATEELFTAETDAKGGFSLSDLPYGYYDLAVAGPDGLFVADQVANVAPTGKNVVLFRLHPFSESTEADRRAFPGSEEDPIGVARVVDQRMVGETFWRSPKGISILAGGGALVLFALAGGGGESNASPFTP